MQGPTDTLPPTVARIRGRWLLPQQFPVWVPRGEQLVTWLTCGSPHPLAQVRPLQPIHSGQKREGSVGRPMLPPRGRREQGSQHPSVHAAI